MKVVLFYIYSFFFNDLTDYLAYIIIVGDFQFIYLLLLFLDKV